jgi:hypothetical protein
LRSVNCTVKILIRKICSGKRWNRLSAIDHHHGNILAAHANKHAAEIIEDTICAARFHDYLISVKVSKEPDDLQTWGYSSGRKIPYGIFIACYSTSYKLLPKNIMHCRNYT